MRGKSQWQIAQELDINQGTVSRHLEALLAEWRASNEFAIDAILHRELAKIDLIEAEAWTAWERSKENKERTTKERASGDSAARSKVVVVTENRLPENEFLKAVMACINKRCEILGLDAATKIKHEGEIDAMSEVEKRAMIAGIAAKLGAMADDRAHEDDGPVADGGGMGSDAEAGEGMGIEAGAAEGCPAVSPGNAPHSGGHWYGAIR